MSFAYELITATRPVSATRNRLSLRETVCVACSSGKQSSNVVLLIAVLAALMFSSVGCVITPPVIAKKIPPSLVLAKDADLIRLQGKLNPNEVLEVRAAVDQHFDSALVIDQLSVSENVTSAAWLLAFLHTVEDILEVSNFSLKAEDTVMTIGGTVSSPDAASAIAEMANKRVGAGMIVNNALNYHVVNVADSEAAQSVVAQPAAALVQPTLQAAVPAIARVPRTTVLDSATAPLKPLGNDSDQDGVPNQYDECQSRLGYPVNERGCQVLDGYMKNVRFYGKTDQLTNRAMKSLDSIADVMREHPVSKIAVLSYTSNTGSRWEMRDQARLRARSVVGYLVQNGVDKTRLQAYAFGHKNGSGDQIVIKEID